MSRLPSQSPDMGNYNNIGGVTNGGASSTSPPPPVPSSPTPSSSTPYHIICTFDSKDARAVLQPNIPNRLWYLTPQGHIVIRDRSGKEVQRINEVSRSGNALCYLAVDATVWVGFASGAIKVFDARTLKLVKEWTRHANNVTTLTQFRGYVASGGADFVVYVWDATSHNHVTQLSGHGNSVNSLVATPTHLFSGSADNTIRVWLCDDAFTCSHVLSGTSGSVMSLLICRGRLWAGFEDGSLRIFDVTDLSLLVTQSEHTRSVNCLAALEREVFSGGVDEYVCIWDSINLILLKTVSCHVGFVSCITRIIVSPTQTEMWTLGHDRKIKCWGTTAPNNTGTIALRGVKSSAGACAECLALQNDVARLQREAQKQIRVLYENMRQQVMNKNKTIERVVAYARQQQDELVRQRQIMEAFDWSATHPTGIDVEREKAFKAEISEKQSIIHKLNEELESQRAAWRQAEERSAVTLASATERISRLQTEASRVADDSARALRLEGELDVERSVNRRLEEEVRQLQRDRDAAHHKSATSKSTAREYAVTGTQCDIEVADDGVTTPTQKYQRGGVELNHDLSTRLDRVASTLGSLIPVLRSVCHQTPSKQSLLSSDDAAPAASTSFTSQEMVQILEFVQTIAGEVSRLSKLLVAQQQPYDNTLLSQINTPVTPATVNVSSDEQLAETPLEEMKLSWDLVQQRCLRLEDELATRDEMISELRNVLSQRDLDIELLRELGKEQTKRGDDLEGDMQQLRHENTALRQRLDKTETEHQALREEIARTSHELEQSAKKLAKAEIERDVAGQQGNGQPPEHSGETTYLRQTVEILLAEKAALEEQKAIMTEMLHKSSDEHWNHVVETRTRPEAATQTSAGARDVEMEDLKLSLKQRERELDASMDIISRLQDEQGIVEEEFRMIEDVMRQKGLDPTSNPEFSTLKKRYQTEHGDGVAVTPPDYYYNTIASITPIKRHSSTSPPRFIVDSAGTTPRTTVAEATARSNNVIMAPAPTPSSQLRGRGARAPDPTVPLIPSYWRPPQPSVSPPRARPVDPNNGMWLPTDVFPPLPSNFQRYARRPMP
eukprot:PhM_4_TR13811/c0_g1_i1/m.18932